MTTPGLRSGARSRRRRSAFLAVICKALSPGLALAPCPALAPAARRCSFYAARWACDFDPYWRSRSSVKKAEPEKQARSRSLSHHSLLSLTLLLLSLTSTFLSHFFLYQKNFQPSHKTTIIKKKLAHVAKQNRPIPQWIRFRTGNKIRYNAKRRHWRRTKLGF